MNARHDPRNLRLLLLLAGLGPILLSATLIASFQGERVDFGDPIEGQRLFVRKDCVRCHAVRGAGGTIGSDLGRKNIGQSYFEIASSMWNHAPGMSEKLAEYRIPHPQFEDDELLDLISFLYFLNYFDEPGDPRDGKILFTEKHCIRCHKVGGEGGTEGPSLDDIPRGTSPLRLAADLWNHGPAMAAAIEKAGLEVPKFEGREILDLFAFIRSHGHRATAPRFQSPGDPARGEQVFESKGCAACHPLFGDEPGVGPDLGRVELRGTVTQIAGRMWNHWPQMARMMEKAGMTVPQFETDELLDMVAYIYIARYRGEAGDAARGRQVFEGKGCSICHGSDGQGGVGPALRSLLEGKSTQYITQAMWNHAPEMQAELRGQNLTWARFEAGDLADLLSFLSSGWAKEPDPSGR